MKHIMSGREMKGKSEGNEAARTREEKRKRNYSAHYKMAHTLI
jgi:hypothetical protein